MTRWQRAARVARTVAWSAVAVGAGAVWIGGRMPWGWSWLVGSLMGALNFQLLASGLRRALGLKPGAAQGAFFASSLVRLGMMGALLYWVSGRGPSLSAGWVLAGVFLPQVVFLVSYYRTREEDSMR
ncbi:MAG: ATP synthase subunit I [Firmicutes bacterium]|nr:ATP synthase subunit I [Alicyclobacillaceae bacterium]MCL6497693.1 ATP synthase subunit I [Bacillota bacterium]